MNSEPRKSSDVRPDWNLVKGEILALPMASVITSGAVALATFSLVTDHIPQAAMGAVVAVGGAAVTRAAFRRIKSRFMSAAP